MSRAGHGNGGTPDGPFAPSARSVIGSLPLPSTTEWSWNLVLKTKKKQPKQAPPPRPNADRDTGTPSPVLYGNPFFSRTYKRVFVRRCFVFNKLAKKRPAASACFAGCQPETSNLPSFP